jgi:hypothetical protein
MAKDPNEEKVTEAEAGVQAEPESTELRAGLATGSQAANPDQPDGHVTQTTVVPLESGRGRRPRSETVVVTDDGQEGTGRLAFYAVRYRSLTKGPSCRVKRGVLRAPLAVCPYCAGDTFDLSRWQAR